MRRTTVLPLIAAGALVAALLPAAVFGLAGMSERAPGAVASRPPAGSPASATAAGPATAASPVTLAHSGRRAAPTAARPAAPATTVRHADGPSVRPIVRPDLHIKLGCALVRPDAPALTDALTIRPDIAPAIACRWTALEVDTLRGYQLWRAVDVPGGGPRELVATIPAGDPLRYVDTPVRRGHVYTYAVIGIAVDGSKLAVSNAVSVKVPPPAEALRMACELGSNGDQRGIACKWARAIHPAAAGYILWRSVDGGPREVIYRTGLDGRLGFFDTKIRPGHTFRYVVVVVDRAGHAVGYGGPEVVTVPPPADTLRMACELAAIGDQRGVACKWSAATHPVAAGYVLWRSVDDGPREAIYRIGLDGRQWYLDPDVKPGQTIRYSVVVVDKDGRAVGHGGPIVVEIPNLAPRDG